MLKVEPLPSLSRSASSDLEVLLIRVGSRTAALPLAQVSSIVAMPQSFNPFGTTTDLYVIAGDPLPYISLWDLFGEKSCYTEYQELQAMLPQRRQDHIDWMAALVDAVRSGRPFTKARDPRECAFGKWFYGYRCRDRRLGLILQQFEQPHAAIHALADRLVRLSENGQEALALNEYERVQQTTLAALLQLFDNAMELIVVLQRRVAIVIGAGSTALALGADSANDIVTVTADRVLASPTARMSAKTPLQLVLLDDSTAVPLIDFDFCAHLDAPDSGFSKEPPADPGDTSTTANNPSSHMG